MKFYRGLGNASRVAGTLGTGAAGAGLILDYNSMRSGDISHSRFGYHLASFGMSVGIGAAYGNIPGAAAGGLFWAGETIYDNIIVPAKHIWWQWEQKLSNPYFYLGNFPY